MKQFLIHIGTYVSGCIVLLMLFIVSFSCIESPLEPVAPTMDTQLSGVPVIDITRYFRDFASKDTVFKFNAIDSTYSYVTTGYTTPIRIDTIKVQPDSSKLQVALGLFEIASLPPTTKSYTLSQLGLSETVYPGGPPPFPSWNVTVPSDSFDFSSQLDYAHIYSGSLTLQITNNLPLRIYFNKPITLRNNQLQPFVDTSIVAEFPFTATIDSFQTVSRTVTLSNIFLRGHLKVDTVQFATEERSTPFSLKNTHGISLQFTSQQLKSDSALAIIPGQPVNSLENAIFTVDDTTAIKEALFKSGSIIITLINSSQVSAQIHVSINELINTDTQSPYTYDTTLTGGDSRIIPVFMDRMRVSAPGLGYGTHAHYSVRIVIINSNGVKKLITQNDLVHAELHPDQPLVIKYAQGRIKPMPLDINSGFKSNFDLGDIGNRLKADFFFKNIKLNLRLPMTSGGVPVEYQNLILTAQKDYPTKSPYSITIPNGTVDPTQSAPLIDLSSQPNFEQLH